MEDLSKKKVTELKQALKERGLPISGAKPELIKRLSEALGVAENSAAALQDIDDDDILNEDATPVETVKPKANVPTAPPTKVTETADSATPNGDSKAAKAAVVSEISGPTDSGDVGPVKPATVSKMSDAERLKLRAEKFGIVSADAKKELRAQRFGLQTSNSGADTGVSVDVLKKRAERFGAVVSSSLTKIDEAERKRKRAERFGMSGSTTTSSVSLKASNGLGSSEEEIKKRKRAERFGLAT